MFDELEVDKPLLLQGDCAELLSRIPDASVDAIITDPPYLYLNRQIKNCEFDKPFDEEKVFLEYKRILKPTGFLLFFGRGVSFYRWNTKIADLGFLFKEEVVWNKVQLSSPFLKLGRRHETIAIYAKTKKACVRKNKIPYRERLNNLQIEEAIKNIKENIRYISSEIKNADVFQELIDYLEKDIINYSSRRYIVNKNVVISKQPVCYYNTRGMSALRTIKEGFKENDIIDIIDLPSTKVPDHPTQKPTRLIERLIAIVSDEGAVILDSFMGSGTTGIACINTNRRFIGMEIDDAYFNIAKKRIEKRLSEEKIEELAFG